MLRPLTMICPEVGGSSRKRSRRSVDLPAPDGPGEEHELAGADEERHVEQGVAKRPVFLGDVEELDHGFSGSPPERLQRARQRLAHGRRIRAAARLLHDLPHEPAERLGLARLVERDLRGIAGDDLGDDRLERSRVAHLRRAPSRRRGRPPRPASPASRRRPLSPRRPRSLRISTSRRRPARRARRDREGGRVLRRDLALLHVAQHLAGHPVRGELRAAPPSRRTRSSPPARGPRRASRHPRPPTRSRGRNAPGAPAAAPACRPPPRPARRRRRRGGPRSGSGKYR